MVQLALRSIIVLGLLFGLVFAVAGAASYHFGLGWTFPVVVTLAFLALQYGIGPMVIAWVHKIDWRPLDSADPELAQFVRAVCAQRGLREPRFGLIHDGNPNAFTFGHYPGNARLVVTTGLLEICDPHERQAVVAHELGHIVHWDFVVMTVAATVPLVLYVIWRLTWSGRRRGREGGAALLVGLAAFLAYLISQYIVLFLSRVREYYADHFSAETTNNPNALATALVKVAYGLARTPKTTAAAPEGQREARAPLVTADAAKALGIFDARFGAAIALAAAGGYGHDGQYSAEVMTRAMRWDLWNPWAFVCEVGSTHPLPAKRLKALENIGRELGQLPAYDLPEPEDRPESYWDEFLVDILVSQLPLIGVALGALAGLGMGLWHQPYLGGIGATLLGLGLGLFARVQFTYPRAEFRPARVAELVQEVKVSQIRSIPCELSGTIIGRGIPGLYWSEDLVIRDETGLIRLDYRQPLRVFEFLFGLFRAESLIGQPASVRGWYRRWPAPYCELWHVRLADGSVHRSHNWAVSFYGSLVLAAAGLALALVGMLTQVPL